MHASMKKGGGEHTAMYVPGRNTRVGTAIVFMDELSRRLSRAICRELRAISRVSRLSCRLSCANCRESLAIWMFKMLSLWAMRLKIWKVTPNVRTLYFRYSRATDFKCCLSSEGVDWIITLDLPRLSEL